MHIIYIDADACPVKEEVYRVARRFAMKVVVAANNPMRIPSGELFSFVEKKGFDGVDDWIAENCGEGDIVVTADIPLAGRSLAKGARVIDTRGNQVTDNDIGAMLATREIMIEIRQYGDITAGGPAPFTPKDRSRFLAELDKTIHAIRKKHPPPKPVV